MSLKEVTLFFTEYGLQDRIQIFDVSSATVSLAAEALHCSEERIAKTLSFSVLEEVILIVTAGDAKIDNAKFKEQFHTKAKMLSKEDVETKIGYQVGGVCPFQIPPDIKIYLDVSLKRFTTVFPACGSSNSAIELTIPELELYSAYTAWIDVCKNWISE